MARNEDLEKALTNFGYELWLYQQEYLGAKEPPKLSWRDQALQWIESNRSFLQSLICEDEGAIKDDLALTGNLVSVIADGIRASKGDAFPAVSAANCVFQYGLQRLCAGYKPSIQE